MASKRKKTSTNPNQRTKPHTEKVSFSKTDLDHHALKILHRLQRYGYEAYFVGGCVRDLFLGRKPKDFDVATSATPQEIRNLFRNCRIIGRRFKLAHIFFGSHIIETATFRSTPHSCDVKKMLEDQNSMRKDLNGDEGEDDSDSDIGVSEYDNDGEFETNEDNEFDDDGDYVYDNGDDGNAESELDGDDIGNKSNHDESDGYEKRDVVNIDKSGVDKSGVNKSGVDKSGVDKSGVDTNGVDTSVGFNNHNDAPNHLLIKHDNVFGNAAEDAARRDFTINGLFYLPEKGMIIDYVGGLEDLKRRVIKTIGDPQVRFREDPVRILRAVKFAARLSMRLEPDTHDAMFEHRHELIHCPPARVLEEIRRLLGEGTSRRAIDLMDSLSVLEILLPEVSEALRIPRRAGALRARLDALDNAVKTKGFQPSRALLLANILIETLEPDWIEQRDIGAYVKNELAPVLNRLKVPRRDKDCMSQMFAAQRRLMQKGSRRRIRGLSRQPYFKEALQLYALGCDSEKEDLEENLENVLEITGHKRSDIWAVPRYSRKKSTPRRRNRRRDNRWDNQKDNQRDNQRGDQRGDQRDNQRGNRRDNRGDNRRDHGRGNRRDDRGDYRGNNRSDRGRGNRRDNR